MANSTDASPRKRHNKESKSKATAASSSLSQSNHVKNKHTASGPTQLRSKNKLRYLSWGISASLFLLALLAYKNNGRLPVYLLWKQDHSPTTTPQHHFDSKPISRPLRSAQPGKDARGREPWGQGQQHFEDNGVRAPSLPYTLPPTRPLPDQPSRQADEEKRSAILNAFTHSWSAYRRDAWGFDEYHPISKSGSNLNGEKGAGIGYTIVDTLDTLILMGFKEEYEIARDWVRDELSWDVSGRMNVFETTIRTLGGLLSAAALIRDPPHPAFAPSEEDANMFVSRAVELADRLLPAFDTPSGVPLREVDLETGEVFADHSNNNSSSLAEATTIQLEFKYLAHLTDRIEYWRVAERPMQVVRRATKTQLRHLQGLVPIFLNPMDGKFYNGEVRLGSRGDSYYEYLIKQWLQTGRTEDVYRDMYDLALKGIKKMLTKPSISSVPPLFFTVELAPRRTMQGQMYMQMIAKQDHLVCFLGGSMMLGSTSLTDAWGDERKKPIPPISDISSGNEVDKEDWRLGHEFIRTCMDTYNKTKTGLAPEITFFRTPQEANMTREMAKRLDRAYVSPEADWYIKKPPPSQKGKSNPLIDARNILRPETVESLFIAFHLTGDEIYREWGWQIFQAFEKHCKVKSGGYSSIDDVDSHKPKQMDRMETFWLSETLKYLFLLFSDQDVLPLSRWVLNTEAHPLPVFSPKFPTAVV